jgi:rhodanese-related sulfurtransferase
MHHVPTVTVQQLPDPLPEHVHVLDVREQAEWDHGHIEGALHVPMMDVPQRLHELPHGRTVVVCKIGGRSAQAVAYLAQQGLDVVNLDGGMIEWAQAGRPMVSETGQPPHVV